MITKLSKKKIFIHIPKTAGSSIVKALNLPNTAHFTIKEMRKKSGWLNFNLSYKFTFVRNPWDRFLSLYYYARMDESYYHSAINPDLAKYGKHLDYDLLKDATLEECANYLFEGRLKHDVGWNHWNPQTSWLLNSREEIGVDFIGRYEQLEKDFEVIKKKLRISGKIGHINASSRNQKKNYQSFYNQSTKKLIFKYYERDIDYFKYAF